MQAKFALSVLVAFMLSLGLGYVFHARLLGPDYAALPSLFPRRRSSRRISATCWWRRR